jgi:hypothetical protein
MGSETAYRIAKSTLMLVAATASVLLIIGLYRWMAEALADPTAPVPLIAVLLVTAASLLSPDRR